jgi:hypothetical protein
MRMGTKSLLFGSHQFLLHPIMVAIGWRRVYGWRPKGWRTWVAIVIHDWGYWGLDNMDGKEGKRHPLWAGAWCADAFGPYGCLHAPTTEAGVRYYDHWWWFVAAHSRYAAEFIGSEPSPLMLPDKLATALLPVPVYAALIWLSGEWVEYADYGRAMGHEVPDGCYGYARWLIDHWRGQFA